MLAESVALSVLTVVWQAELTVSTLPLALVMSTWLLLQLELPLDHEMVSEGVVVVAFE